MVQGLVLLHSTDPTALTAWLPHAEWTMVTCLRGLALFTEESLPEALRLRALDPNGGVEMRVDEEAYGFLLEIVCGLHSPIVGETEVMGQFKGSLAQLEKTGGPTSSALPFLRPILVDAKKIRTDNFRGQGGQSYGSLCRRELQGMRTVHLLGAGKLTKDLLPWFLEFPRVEVYCRSIKKGTPLKDAYPKVEIFPWSETAGRDVRGVGSAAAPTSSDAAVAATGAAISADDEHHDAEFAKHSALVIAAPVSEAELTGWMDLHGHAFGKVIDLRGDVHAKSLRPAEVSADTIWISLDELFASVRANQEALGAKVAAVKSEIEVLVRKKADRMQIRPLGWDEICA